MNATGRFARFIYLCLVVMSLCPHDLWAQSQGKVVWDRDQLLDAGVTRPADILDHLDAWTSWSIDGFAVHASANALSNYSQERWALFVDGRRIERGLHGTIDLNMLPFTLQQLDSVEVFSTPTIIRGQYVMHGAVHIHTRNQAKGMDMGASMYSGNEINDPGPFRYLDGSLPNIDRIGPDIGGYLSGGHAGFFLTGSAVYREHHSTDAHISHRSRALHDNSNHSPRILLFAPGIRAGYTGNRSSSEFVLTRSTLDDIAFVRTYGAEIPVRQTYSSMAFNGSYRLGGSAEISASVTATEEFNHGRFNYLAWDPNLKLDLLRARGSVKLQWDELTATVGGGADLFRARPGSFALVSDHYTIYRYTMTVDHPTNRWLNQFGVEVGTVGGRVLPKVTMHRQGNRLRASASLSRNAILEDHSVLYWATMGYRGFESLGTVPNNYADVNTNTLATLDAEVDAVKLRTFRLSTSAGLRFSRSDWATIDQYVYSNAEKRFKNDARLIADLGGSSLITSLRAEWNNRIGFDHIVSGTLRHAVNGGDLYRELHREMPRYDVSYRLLYRHTPGFTASGRVKWNAPTEWRSFFSTSTEGTPFYGGPVVPTQLETAVSFRKTLLNHRAWLALNFENVLNRALQTWPAGEVRDMTFHLSIGASLRSPSSSRYSADPFSRPLY